MGASHRSGKDHCEEVRYDAPAGVALAARLLDAGRRWLRHVPTQASGSEDVGARLDPAQQRGRSAAGPHNLGGMLSAVADEWDL